MNSFVKGVKEMENATRTENGAFALKSTNSRVLDLFGVIGSLRTRVEDVVPLFGKAFAEDALLATKMSFYARNIRGGLGERNTPRVIWKYLATVHPNIMRKNLQYIPTFGRWDDMYCLVGTPVEADMWDVVRTQFVADCTVMRKSAKDGEKEPISLMAKWLKSPTASSRESRVLGMKTARALKLSDKEYRQILSAMRKYLDVVEVKLSDKTLEDVNYSTVPSRAMSLYRKAFERNDPARFDEYMQSLSNGDTKINASTLYPYDIMGNYKLDADSYGGRLTCGPYDSVLEAQWNALPNYVEPGTNALVMADTSASMDGRPLDSAIGLALYFAERNIGDFHNLFMTFSASPKFVTVEGDTLCSKIKNIDVIVSNTNIEAAFARILEFSKSKNIKESDMPRVVLIVSDMEFDSATTRGSTTYYDHMANKYAEAGYTIPNVVFWNVASRHDVFHVSADVKGVQLVSGQSVSTFKNILANIGKTPYEAVLDILNSPQYSMITV